MSTVYSYNLANRLVGVAGAHGAGYQQQWGYGRGCNGQDDILSGDTENDLIMPPDALGFQIGAMSNLPFTVPFGWLGGLITRPLDPSGYGLHPDPRLPTLRTRRWTTLSNRWGCTAMRC